MKIKINNKMDWVKWQVTRSPSITEQVETWLSLIKEQGTEDWNDCEVRATGWELLLRCKTNDISENCMVIATIRLEFNMQNQDVFKSFLNYLSDVSLWQTIAIEDIEKQFLIDFCKKYQFKQISQNYPNSYRIDKRNLVRFPVKEFNNYLSNTQIIYSIEKRSTDI